MKAVVQILFLLAVAFFVFPSHVCAQEKMFDSAVLTGAGRQAYQSLLKVKLFAIGGIGYGGRTSDGEEAFDVLLAEKYASSAFKSLLDEATIEGGMYGLLGLKIIDCDCYESELSSFLLARTDEHNKESFKTQSGCLVADAKSSDEKSQMINYIVVEGFEQFKKMKLQRRIAK